MESIAKVYTRLQPAERWLVDESHPERIAKYYPTLLFQLGKAINRLLKN